MQTHSFAFPLIHSCHAYTSPLEDTRTHAYTHTHKHTRTHTYVKKKWLSE